MVKLGAGAARGGSLKPQAIVQRENERNEHLKEVSVHQITMVIRSTRTSTLVVVHSVAPNILRKSSTRTTSAVIVPTNSSFVVKLCSRAQFQLPCLSTGTFSSSGDDENSSKGQSVAFGGAFLTRKILEVDRWTPIRMRPVAKKEKVMT